MNNRRRRTLTTIETHETWIIRRPSDFVLLCAACHDPSGMLAPLEAAQRAGVSQRTIYRWVEEGSVHFAETADGRLFICLAPLIATRGEAARSFTIR